jgi:hypothetical protein
MWTPQHQASDGGRLHEVLDAQLRAERAHGARRTAGTIAVVLGALVWGCAVVPSWLGADLRRLVLSFFALAFAVLAAATVTEWRYRRKILSVIQGGRAEASSRASPNVEPQLRSRSR